MRLVDEQNLRKALKKSRADNKRIGETLVSMGVVTEDDVTEAVAKQFGLEYVNLDDVQIPQSALKLIP